MPGALGPLEKRVLLRCARTCPIHRRTACRLGWCGHARLLQYVWGYVRVVPGNRDLPFEPRPRRGHAVARRKAGRGVVEVESSFTPLIDVAGAAQALGVSVRALYKLVEGGHLEYVRVGV